MIFNISEINTFYTVYMKYISFSQKAIKILEFQKRMLGIYQIVNDLGKFF